MTAILSEVPSCRVLIVNEVLDTRRVLTIPSPVSEAMENVHAILLAKHWIEWQESAFSNGEESVQVVLRQSQDSIEITWHVAPGADPEAARIRMRELLAGRGEGCAP
ncbi:MAG TPA: hypothetical protein VMY42_29045 [Thermoguttaceae bacterium]|nr:hypothetical protein [Thermoguttaceae bacterium]